MARRPHWTSAHLDAGVRHALGEGLSSSQLWSLLDEICAQRAERRSPAEIRRQFERDGFVQPSAVSPTRMIGGCFDWLAKLGNDRRLVFVASAIGSPLIAQLFPASPRVAVGAEGSDRI